MLKINLSEMDVGALLLLQDQIEETLCKHRAEVERQLERLNSAIGVVGRLKTGASALKGTKVPPKYRSPSGETWAGRGAKPRWLVAAMKSGKKLDDFLIEKAARKG